MNTLTLIYAVVSYVYVAWLKCHRCVKRFMHRWKHVLLLVCLHVSHGSWEHIHVLPTLHGDPYITLCCTYVFVARQGVVTAGFVSRQGNASTL